MKYIDSTSEECPLCQLPLGSVECYNSHIKRGGAGYKCQVCDYGTIYRPDVCRHVRIHTGEKPYCCPHCPYRATQQSSVKGHIRHVHRGSYLFSPPVRMRSQLVKDPNLDAGTIPVSRFQELVKENIWYWTVLWRRAWLRIAILLPSFLRLQHQKELELELETHCLLVISFYRERWVITSKIQTERQRFREWVKENPLLNEIHPFILQLTGNPNSKDWIRIVEIPELVTAKFLVGEGGTGTPLAHWLICLKIVWRAALRVSNMVTRAVRAREHKRAWEHNSTR